MRKILIILGHPRLQSYNAALANAYGEGALTSGADVKLLELAKLQFATNIAEAPDYDNRISEVEPSLKEAQNLLCWADHLVFIYPTFWGDMPALLKAFIDRAFLPGIAFKYRKVSPLPEKLLKGKTARIITTLDAPVFYYQLMYYSPGTNALKRATLHFCGVKPVYTTFIGRVRYLTETQRKNWLERINQLGQKDAHQAQARVISERKTV